MNSPTPPQTLTQTPPRTPKKTQYLGFICDRCAGNSSTSYFDSLTNYSKTPPVIKKFNIVCDDLSCHNCHSYFRY